MLSSAKAVQRELECFMFIHRESPKLSARRSGESQSAGRHKPSGMKVSTMARASQHCSCDTVGGWQEGLFS